MVLGVTCVSIRSEITLTIIFRVAVSFWGICQRHIANLEDPFLLDGSVLLLVHYPDVLTLAETAVVCCFHWDEESSGGTQLVDQGWVNGLGRRANVNGIIRGTFFPPKATITRDKLDSRRGLELGAFL